MSEQSNITAELVAAEGKVLNRQVKDQELKLVSLVVPLYNEAACVTSLMVMLVELDIELAEEYNFEFLLIDDGSTDETASLLSEAILDRPNFRLISYQKNCGIAAAIHTGVRQASSEIVVSIDADGSYDALLIRQMLPLLTPEVDMVTASPYHPLGAVENVPFWRLWLSRRASGLYRLGLRQKLHCYTSCFRVYRRSKTVDLEPENAGFVGVAELAWRLDRQGSQIVECPATLRTRVAGHSKMRVFRSAIRHLHLVSQIWRDRIRSRLAGDPR